MEISDGMIGELQEYHRAMEAARRYNRNLLQYGAAMAGMLGVGAGGSGIFVVAAALGKSRAMTSPETASTKLPLEFVVLLWGVMGLAAVLFLAIAVLLAGAYQRRRDAEAKVDSCLESLIERTPERFLPGESVTQQPIE